MDLNLTSLYSTGFSKSSLYPYSLEAANFNGDSTLPGDRASLSGSYPKHKESFSSQPQTMSWPTAQA
jgi:hypothetical protein